MFRASHITSACGGLLFGGRLVVDADFVFAPPAFFIVTLLLVVGWPQYREALARRRERAALRQIHHSHDWQRLGDDMSSFYVPVWLRMLTFVICTVFAAIIVKHYAA
jgi:hypothetical protein